MFEQELSTALKQTINLSSLTLKSLLCLCQAEFSRVAVSNAGEGNCRLGVGTGLLSEHSAYLPSMLVLQSRLICCERSLSPCLSYHLCTATITSLFVIQPTSLHVYANFICLLLYYDLLHLDLYATY